MADNYLEKRMDDYAKGRLGKPTAHTGRRAGYAQIKFPQQTIFIVSADLMPEVLATMAVAGMKVFFTCSDPKQGQQLAQRCGGRFYPIDNAAIAADLAARGDKVDTLIAISTADVPDTGQRKSIYVGAERPAGLPEAVHAITGQSPEASAILALAWAHPSVN